MDEKKKKRWLIIAAVVACGGVGGLFLLGVVAGIAIPAWLSSVRSANETAAIRTIKTIVAEERGYFSDHDGFANFDQLIEAGDLDKRFAGESPVVEHYVFTMKVTPGAGNNPPNFTLNADPQQAGGFNASGRHHFFWASTSPGIRVSEERRATVDDPMLEDH